MNSETVGISADDPEAYDIDDVQWAMRLTYSGEFIHAAPWSVGSQGCANVSHGCTGMSTADAGWLYAMSRRGDVVEYTGTDRWMTLDQRLRRLERLLRRLQGRLRPLLTPDRPGLGRPVAVEAVRRDGAQQVPHGVPLDP